MTGAGLIVAAPASGSGKTVFTLGLLRALCRRGVAVAAAKVGPDYIDPAFLAAASGATCANLDAWAMRPCTLAGRLAALASASLIVCEGVMGLFDGAATPPGEPSGSTADIAALTGWPVLLVVDASRQGASVAALLRGFRDHRSDVALAGVVFNRVGSASHRAVIEAACAAHLPGLQRLGWLPRDRVLELPERHLGLVQASETAGLGARLDAIADLVERHADLDGILALARPSNPMAADAGPPLPPLGQRIAVARDEAFAFAYPATLQGWRAAGAELTFFSPLADEPPDAAADAVYLPGGYPELHAGRLAAARRFLRGLRGLANQGAAIWGECGGAMALGTTLTDGDGADHAMAGLLPLATSFQARRLHLGYRQCRLLADAPLGRAGSGFRGHEFHYASVTWSGAAAPLFALRDAAGSDLGQAGLVAGRVMGSFIHLVDRADPAPDTAGPGENALVGV